MNCVKGCATQIPLSVSAAINHVGKHWELKRRPWALLLLIALACFFNSLAALAQQTVYVEAVKPEYSAG